ncbi:antitoxin CptB [Sinobacterium caligoides]|uniref:FAD assembly factor SdhE n=1 Tax=Sinobacterium caligoides TaxID=933926 RepID=A0A3N2DY65_9GAMM|nr:succinate dehydrogenase assembly factor 2 [Sinobacterium caligoides]ROS04727.1 antitoxin CptB [Sinobacterium caligoides]
MISETEYKRIGWHSRRGMLELDLVLGPFYRDQLLKLADSEQQLYIKLLTCEDQDMFRWFLKAELPEDPEIATIVKLILEHNRSLA